MKYLSNKGFGLPSVMASAATASALLLAVAGSSGLFTKSMRSLEMKGELEDLRTLVRTNLDCQVTIESQEAACQTGDFVEGRRKDNKFFFAGAANGTEFGRSKHHVRSRCVDNGGHYELAVEYNRESKDPLTKQERDWGDLFNGIPYECGAIGPKNILPGVFFKYPNFQEVMEPAAGNDDEIVTVIVYLTGAATVDVKVPIKITNGLGVSFNQDYSGFRDSKGVSITPADLDSGIIIPPGDTEYLFEFDVHPDMDWGESDEEIIFEIGDPENAKRVSSETHTVNILNFATCVGEEVVAFQNRTLISQEVNNVVGAGTVPFDNNPGPSELFYDMATAKKVCEIVTGYPHVMFMDCNSMHKGALYCGWTSPGDNRLTRWNPGTDSWETGNAATMGNKWIGSLTCDCDPVCTPLIDNDGGGSTEQIYNNYMRLTLEDRDLNEACDNFFWGDVNIGFSGVKWHVKRSGTNGRNKVITANSCSDQTVTITSNENATASHDIHLEFRDQNNAIYDTIDYRSNTDFGPWTVTLLPLSTVYMRMDKTYGQPFGTVENGTDMNTYQRKNSCYSGAGRGGLRVRVCSSDNDNTCEIACPPPCQDESDPTT